MRISDVVSRLNKFYWSNHPVIWNKHEQKRKSNDDFSKNREKKTIFIFIFIIVNIICGDVVHYLNFILCAFMDFGIEFGYKHSHSQFRNVALLCCWLMEYTYYWFWGASSYLFYTLKINTWAQCTWISAFVNIVISFGFHLNFFFEQKNMQKWLENPLLKSVSCFHIYKNSSWEKRNNKTTIWSSISHWKLNFFFFLSLLG